MQFLYRDIQTTHLPKSQIEWGSMEPQDIVPCATSLGQVSALCESSIPSGLTLLRKGLSPIRPKKINLPEH